ncbi:MAG TPA: hypothetical protein VLJ76_01220, partial [Gaiellaceae bacterium]|nr:hypothetical protein [Gaiellaceae bacterium]
MPSRWQGFQRVGRIVPVPIALCALGGHYALYGALVPTGGAHAYLRWYEPVVAGLSITALTLLGALVAASFTGSERLRRRVSQVAAPFAA